MDTKHQPTVEPTDEKPVAVAHLEDKSELGPDKHAGAVDYTGAEAKTDPEEIALVRKIDWRLMVSYSGKDRIGARRWGWLMCMGYSRLYASCTS